MNIHEVKKATNKLVKDYNKPTPKGWKIAGRILKIIGRTLAGTALLGAVGPYVGLTALLAGEVIGEVINFKTE